MVMSWCLRVPRIVCNLMNMCLSNLQIPIAVLGYKGSGSNGGARSCYGGFHTASKGCVKQDDGCCKGQRPQTVCHHHQSPRKLIVASLSTLSGQITSDALQEGSTFWKDGSSNQNVWSGMRKKKIRLPTISEYIFIPEYDGSQMQTTAFDSVLIQVAKRNEKQQDRSYTLQRSSLSAWVGLC